MADPPREPSAHLIRGAHAALLTLRFLRDPLHCLGDMRGRHGPFTLVESPLGAHRRRFALALGPAANREVLPDVERFRTSGQGLSGPRGSALRRIRNGLTRTRGEKHRRIRQTLMPAFQRRSVEAAHAHIRAIVDAAFDRWTPGDDFDLAADMGDLSRRISAEVVFAIRDPQHAARLGALLEGYLERSFSLRVLAFPVPLPGTPYRALQKHADLVEEAIGSLIARRRAEGLGDARDPIASLLRARDERVPWLEEDDLVGQVTLLFGASYETTAVALTWTLFLIAQHPRLAGELLEEIDAAARGGELSFEGVAALPLLDGVVRESLRLFPAIPYTLRIDTRGGPLGPLALRRGDRVICCHHTTHRDPSVFEHPLRFDPRRWERVKPEAHEYLPFSVAPRMCPGAGLATAVMKETVVRLMPRFRLEVRDGARIEPIAKVTLRARGGVPVRALAQDRAFRAAQVRGSIHRSLELVRS